MNIGDFVKGLPGSHYGITNEKMTRGVITAIDGDSIKVKVIEHTGDGSGTHLVNPKYFEVTGHVKPFSREEVLELLLNGCKKALLDYDLRDADLSGADLDFSCWPLWCGSLNIKTSTRHAYQLAYHLCSMQCDDEEYIKMRNKILGFANKFHRVDECGKLEKIELQK